jgi:hypothetical protein
MITSNQEGLPMKIPTKICIKKGIEYEVVYVDEIESNPNLMGLCRDKKETRQRQIVLKRGMSKKDTWQTYIHELLHVIEFEFKIKISHKLIDQLEAPIFQILKLNGWVS